MRSGTISMRRVTKSFGGTAAAIADVDLDVAQSEIRAIIGPNGAGKTTLLNLISGIGRPDRGTIVVGPLSGRRLRADHLARNGISRTFQNLALFEGLSVEGNVAMGYRAAGRTTGLEFASRKFEARRARAEARKDVEAVLALLDLGGVRDRAIASLSYGLRKRVELARAIVAKPTILLLDEPLAGVGAKEKADLARRIAATRDEFGTTILLIEHDIAVVMALADRIAVLDHGRKIADGSPGEIRRDRAVIDAYLGSDPIGAAA